MNKRKIDKLSFYNWKHPRLWFSNIKIFFRNIKYRWQRAWYGVSDMDTWSLDCYLLDVMENGLKQYKENTNGYPGTITEEEWDNILDRMIELVSELKIDWFAYEGDMSYREFDAEYAAKQKELFDLLGTWFHHLWW